MHEQSVIDLFSIKPKVFRNTELIYSNYIGWQVAELGYDALLTEAVPRYLGDRAKTQLFRSHTHNPIPLLLKHADFSDDVAFRFSNKQWPGHPLTAEKYLHWVEMYGEHELINLFMDFETFGEHQWADTGIFDFVHSFFHQFLARSWNQCVTPSDVVEQLALDTAAISDLPVYDVPDPISWADVDRDLTAWRDNSMQHDALRLIYSLEQQVKATNDLGIIDDWRRLQTSDHFYYMCTKWAADGDVHAYFSPFDSPYEAYRRFAIALADLQERLIPS
jgi:alpha-amylase